MDLKDIESWGRELLEHEAAKRGVRSPEVYSRTELVRLILKHDYGAPTNMKEAARLIGGLLGSAKEALKKRLDAPLQGSGVKTYAGAGRQRHAQHAQSRSAASAYSARPAPREARAGGEPQERGAASANAVDARGVQPRSASEDEIAGARKSAALGAAESASAGQSAAEGRGKVDASVNPQAAREAQAPDRVRTASGITSAVEQPGMQLRDRGTSSEREADAPDNSQTAAAAEAPDRATTESGISSAVEQPRVQLRDRGTSSEREADARDNSQTTAAAEAPDRARTESGISSVAEEPGVQLGDRGASPQREADAPDNSQTAAAAEAPDRARTESGISSVAEEPGVQLGERGASPQREADAPDNSQTAAAAEAPNRARTESGISSVAEEPGVQLGDRGANAQREADDAARTGFVGSRNEIEAYDDLERSYVGDRPLELPGLGATDESRPAARLGRSLMPRQRTTATESEVAPTEKAARESAEEELERSHVSGLKFDLAAAAELDGVRAAFDAARASEGNTAPRSPEQLTFEAREASIDSEPAPRARLPEDDDELRDAERVRQEARETRRESERVRADARAAGQHEAEWERPEAGWHEVRLAPAVEATDAPTEGESHGAASSQPLAAGLSAPEQATLGSGDSGVHLAAEVAARSEGDVSIEAGEANRKAAAPPAQETHDGEQALSEVGVREVARDESLETDAAREVARDVIGAPLVPHLRLVEPLSVSPDDGAGERAKRGDGEEAELRAAALSEPAFAEPALAAPEDESHPREQGTAAETPQIEPAEHITYGPHPQDGMLLRWRVTPEAIERARKLLGSSGELAVRIVAVRVEPHAVVKTDVIDHGPIEESGDWTAPLLPTEARYVSAVGLKSANKFVSIVHAKS